MMTLIPVVVHRLPVKSPVEMYEIQDDVCQVEIDCLALTFNRESSCLSTVSGRRTMSLSSNVDGGSTTNSNSSSSQTSSGSAESLGSQMQADGRMCICKYIFQV